MWSSKHHELYLWRAVAPEHYCTMGLLVTSTFEKPPLDSLVCIQQDKLRKQLKSSESALLQLPRLTLDQAKATCSGNRRVGVYLTAAEQQSLALQAELASGAHSRCGDVHAIDWQLLQGVSEPQAKMGRRINLKVDVPTVRVLLRDVYWMPLYEFEAAELEADYNVMADSSTKVQASVWPSVWSYSVVRRTWEPVLERLNLKVLNPFSSVMQASVLDAMRHHMLHIDVFACIVDMQVG